MSESNTPEKTAADYTIGQAVAVYAHGYWYVGEVTKIGRTRVHAEYTTGTGTTRTTAFPMGRISDDVTLTERQPKRGGGGRRRGYTIVEAFTPRHANRADARVLTDPKVTGMHKGMRLLVAFQGLGLPAGMTLTRGASRTFCANIVNEFLGCKAVTRASRPPRNLSGLEAYVAWAMGEAEVRAGGSMDWKIPASIAPDMIAAGIDLTGVLIDDEAAAS